MGDRATAANPNLLRWARNCAGYSKAEAAEKIGKSAQDIRDWEKGRGAPTYVQLEKLAERVYKRAVGIFFFPEPPAEEPLEGEFRTLPEADRGKLNPKVRLQLRKAKSFLLSLKELTDGANPSKKVIWRDIEPTLNSSVAQLARTVRDYLGVSREEQGEWRDSRVAMKEWRRRVQSAGVFVFKESFSTQQVSGFCLYDADFPVVMINNTTPKTRQMFTLFHELSHILFGVSGVTPRDLSYVDNIGQRNAKRLEVLCNIFAGEVLVPSDSFPLERLLRADEQVAEVEAVADEYSVSREVILRKLLDAGVVDQSTYEEWAEGWADQREKEGGPGGDYYRTKMSYLGEAYLGLALSQYESDAITRSELADHLDMRATTVDTMLAEYID